MLHIKLFLCFYPIQPAPVRTHMQDVAAQGAAPQCHPITPMPNYVTHAGHHFPQMTVMTLCIKSKWYLFIFKKNLSVNVNGKFTQQVHATSCKKLLLYATSLLSQRTFMAFMLFNQNDVLSLYWITQYNCNLLKNKLQKIAFTHSVSAKPLKNQHIF